MKHILFVIFFMAAGALHGQEIVDMEDTTAAAFKLPDVEPEQNLLETPVQHGIYGAATLQSATIGPTNTMSMLAGAQMCWVLNKKYIIGLEATGLATRVKAPPLEPVNGLILITNFGGLYLGYTPKSHKLLHLEFGSLFGMGQAFYRDTEYRARYNQIDAFVIVEPKVNLILNVVPGFRLGGGISYRAVQRVDLLGMTNADLRGLSANLIIKIGRF